MMVTARRIPVADPMAPMKSAITMMVGDDGDNNNDDGDSDGNGT